MDNNTATVLVVLVIALMMITISFLIFFDTTTKTELEKCMKSCNYLRDGEREAECKISCMNHFSNCSTIELQGGNE